MKNMLVFGGKSAYPHISGGTVTCDHKTSFLSPPNIPRILENERRPKLSLDALKPLKRIRMA